MTGMISVNNPKYAAECGMSFFFIAREARARSWIVWLRSNFHEGTCDVLAKLNDPSDQTTFLSPITDKKMSSVCDQDYARVDGTWIEAFLLQTIHFPFIHIVHIWYTYTKMDKTIARLIKGEALYGYHSVLQALEVAHRDIYTLYIKAESDRKQDGKARQFTNKILHLAKIHEIAVRPLE